VVTPLALAILVNQNCAGLVVSGSLLHASRDFNGGSWNWKWLYAENGLLNQLLKQLGVQAMGGNPWLTSPNWALSSALWR